MNKILKTLAISLALLMVGSTVFVFAYWWSGSAWHDTPAPPTGQVTEAGPGPYAVFRSLDDASSYPRLDLRLASAADDPLMIYQSYSMGTGPRMDTSVIPRSAAESILQVSRTPSEALMLAGSADGLSDWSVSDGLLIESFVDGALWSTIQLGTKEPLLDGMQTNIPQFGPARNEFAGREINIGSIVPPNRDTVLRFSVITFSEMASVSDLYLLKTAVDFP